jgi:hypothetical protein
MSLISTDTSYTPAAEARGPVVAAARPAPGLVVPRVPRRRGRASRVGAGDPR